MDDLRPLAIYPWPLSAADMEKVKAAKAATGVPFRVLPCPAVPGTPVRILALRELPAFVCDTTPPVDPDNPDSLTNALRWVLDETEPVERGVTVLKYLKAIFGPETRELEPERIGVHFE
jgi:hypothetical protein